MAPATRRQKIAQQAQALLQQADVDVMTKAQKVFGIPELFEMIAKGLPYQGIENARQVSKSFKDNIDASMQVQKLRFFIADSKPQGRPIHIWVHQGASWPSGHYYPPATKQDVAKEIALDSSIATPVVVLHPILRHLKEMESFIHPVLAVNIEFPGWKVMLGWPEGGPWEKALITQPPCTSMELCINDKEFEGPFPRYKCVVVRNQDGVRLVDVVTALRELALQPRWMLPAVYRRDFLQWTVGGWNSQVVRGIVRDVLHADSIWVRQAKRHEKSLKRKKKRDAKGRFVSKAAGFGSSVE